MLTVDASCIGPGRSSHSCPCSALASQNSSLVLPIEFASKFTGDILAVINIVCTYANSIVSRLSFFS